MLVQFIAANREEILRAHEGGGREAIGAHRYRGGVGGPASLPRSARRNVAPVDPLARHHDFECRGPRRGPSRPRSHGGAGCPRLLRHLLSHQRARQRDACADHGRGSALNTWLDNAIAEAVTEYSRLRDKSAAAGETERLGAFAHELRNRLTSAQLAFETIKSGRAPVGGSIATVVTQSLQAMTALISRTLLEVRVDSGNVRRQRTNLRGLVEEVEVGGTVEAGARGVSLRVDPIDPGIDVDADPQILAEQSSTSCRTLSSSRAGEAASP